MPRDRLIEKKVITGQLRRSRLFPGKRGSHHQYRLAEWNWLDVYRAVNDAGGLAVHGSLGDVAQQYGISYNTLRGRYRAWVSAGRPLNIETCPSASSAALLGLENHDGHNKIFSDSQEKQIADVVKQEFFNKRIAGDREDLKLILLQFHQQFFARPTRSNPAPPFHASDGFVSERFYAPTASFFMPSFNYE